MQHLTCQERSEFRRMLEFLASTCWKQHQYFGMSENVCAEVELMIFDYQEKLRKFEESTKTQCNLKAI